jgi:hypothetical protein
MNFKQKLQQAGRKLAEHSPVIFTGLGIAGLGATAYLAYKSRDKVEEVVEEIERKNDLELEVNKAEVAKDIAEAIYKPVLVGALSVTCIVMAHRIQHKRILTLAGALAVEQSRNIWFEQKYRKQHGNEEWNKFVIPTDEIETVEVGKNGKDKITVTQVKSDVDKSLGQWYSDSEEYARDDHHYNMEMIRSKTETLQTILFQRGSLTLNEVREALGFERIRSGALLGWTTADSFDIETHVANIGEEELGEAPSQIWVTWSHPSYIYDKIEFNGRYNQYGK